MISKILQFLLCFALVAPICDAFFHHVGDFGLWCSENQFPQNSSYGTNLKRLLSFISSNASNHDRYYSINTTSIFGTSDSETIYGLFECQADSTLEVCKGCKASALGYLPPKNCARDKEVMIWYHSCFIHYSNKPFLGNLEENVRGGVRNADNFTTITGRVDAQGFMRLVNHTLHKLVDKMSSSSGTGILKYFKTNTTRVTHSVTLYTMVRCTPTLSLREIAG